MGSFVRSCGRVVLVCIFFCECSVVWSLFLWWLAITLQALALHCGGRLRNGHLHVLPVVLGAVQVLQRCLRGGRSGVLHVHPVGAVTLGAQVLQAREAGEQVLQSNFGERGGGSHKQARALRQVGLSGGGEARHALLRGRGRGLLGLLPSLAKRQPAHHRKPAHAAHAAGSHVALLHGVVHVACIGERHVGEHVHSAHHHASRR
mmetsp:Transcript_43186/g.109082  ORF Transcript_43186/g.109082 Transcript_43186/m.109082 type:complete len:204 (-) Transcript_43186:291-902(-)